jgi:hypothetical protein
MGYRVHIAKLPKKEYNQITKSSEEELINYYLNHPRKDELLHIGDDLEDTYLSVNRISEDLIEITNYFFAEGSPKLTSKNAKRLFKHKSLKNEECYDDKYVVTKEWLYDFIMFSIERYSTWHESVVTESMSSIVENDIEKLRKSNLFYFLKTSNILDDFEMSDKKGNSPLIFNHSTWAPGFIINMIYIYKTFDFKKYVLVINPW